MAATLLVPPATEPWTVADAKSFLRVETDDDDVLIAALITSARGQVEALTRRGLITQTWRLVLDGWPRDGRIAPRLAPLRAVTAARIYDAAGNAVAIDVERFVVDVAAATIAAPPRGRCRCRGATSRALNSTSRSGSAMPHPMCPTCSVMRCVRWWRTGTTIAGWPRSARAWRCCPVASAP
jgi:uncharacterized phiE125 gp8 family phage protein